MKLKLNSDKILEKIKILKKLKDILIKKTITYEASMHCTSLKLVP